MQEILEINSRDLTGGELDYEVVDLEAGELNINTIDLDSGALETVTVDASRIIPLERDVAELKSRGNVRYDTAQELTEEQQAQARENIDAQESISDLDEIRSNAASGASKVSNIQSDWNATTGDAAILNKPNLSNVATSGNYNDLSNKPSIPSQLSDLSSDSTHRLVSDAEKSTWNNKQDAIDDLEDIRENASAGATALQSEEDPIFSASAASGITAEDIASWNEHTSNIGTITGVSVNGTSVATSGVANISSVPASILEGTVPNGITAITQNQGDGSNKIATTSYVDTAINNLPDPMIFRGSLGTGGTITTLPTAASTNVGYTYKVIEDGTYANQSAKIGDTFISDGSAWILIPSGDEPSGTVTSIKIEANSPIQIDNDAAISTSGTRTLSHATSGVTAGTYRAVTVNNTGHVTAGTTEAIYILTTNWNSTATQCYLRSQYFLNSLVPTQKGDLILCRGNGNLFKCGDLVYDSQEEVYYTNPTYLCNVLVAQGTSSQFVKGDGSLDSNIYLTSSSLSTYAPLASPALTGTPTAPTAASGTNTTQIATTAFVQSAVPKDYQIDYSKTYLTFEALENGTFTFTLNALQYSIDNGVTWTSLANGTASPTVSAGNKILWKQTGLTPTSLGLGYFSATGNFKAYGNVMSLYYGDNFVGQTSLSGKSNAFKNLFASNTKIVDASNLVLPATTLISQCYYQMFSGCTSLTIAPRLPATTLTTYCYQGMFNGCTSLTTAPILPATTLANGCYSYMFDGCSNLNYIKAMFTTTPSMSYTSDWVSGVAASGTFVKNDSATWTTTGVNAVPTGWTAYTESEWEIARQYQINALTTAIGSKLDQLSTSTDNAVIRFDGTSGNIQDSGVTINDSNHLTAAKLITSGGTSSQFVKGDGSLDSNTYAGAQTNGGAANKAVSIPFGQVDSTSTSTAFTATVDGITELRDGVCVYLKNGVVTSAANCTLNINGLGAKPMYNTMAATTAISTQWNVNYTMLFIYNSTRVSGGCWDMFYGYYSDSDYVGYRLRRASSVLPASDTSRYYKIFFTSADNTKWVPASADSTNNATSARPVNQRPINPFGPIEYFYSSSSVGIGTDVPVSSLWQQYNITLGYSFNRTGAALTLTIGKPIFIKCAPQNDGSAIIDANTPYVQDLPTSEDGKIYIFLGVAYSATQVEMQMVHPVYYYKNGSINLWTGTGTQTDVSKSTESNVIDVGGYDLMKINEVKGKSLVMNQLVSTSRFYTKQLNNNEGTFTNNGDGTYTITTTGTTENTLIEGSSVVVVVGHKILIKRTGDVSKYITMRVNGNENKTGDTIFTATGINVFPRIASGLASGTYTIRFIVIDLTQMFGAGNEPTTVEEVEAILGNGYNEYNTGEVVGNNVEKLDVYDSNDTKKGSLALNLTELTGKVNGEGTSVTIFPDGLHGVGTAYDSLIVDDDGYARKAVKRMGSVDLGSLTWSKSIHYNHNRFAAPLGNVYKESYVPNIIDNYGYKAANNPVMVNDVDMTLAAYGSGIYLRNDTYENSTAEDFKTAMSGVMLYYELDTPIEYVLDTPVQCVAKVYPNGTVKQVPVMPDSTPMVMDVTYLRDAGGFIGGMMNKLASLEARIAALEEG